MTIEEHIQALIDESKIDLGASEALGVAGYYGHSLFFAHLVLEKLCKALWIKKKNSNKYPHIHNLIKLMRDAAFSLNEEQIKFYTEMNLFQIEGRYPETLKKIENAITKEMYDEYCPQIKTEIVCLIELLQ